MNIAVCPTAIWTVLVMLWEAAAGRTKDEIARVLGDISNDNFGEAYNALKNEITALRRGGGEFSLINYIIREEWMQLEPQMNNKLKNTYGVKDFPVNPKNAVLNAQTINKWVKETTKGKIKEIILPADFENFKFVLGNVATFTGKWKFPFMNSSTFNDVFQNEDDVILNSIPMMTEKLILKYAFSPLLDSQVVEIPYADDKTSMIVILPKKKVNIGTVIEKMKGKSLVELLPELTLEEVELYLPKFEVYNDLNMNRVLFNMGIVDLLTDRAANLPKLSPQVYVNKVTHKVNIRNSEEGTTASAITNAHVSYKTSLANFHANRPFIYFINDVKSRSVLFAGTITNPNAV